MLLLVFDRPRVK